MSINERIKLIVDKYYDSQADLAKELGVSRVAIGGYINSERKPNFEMLEKFYELGYNINWLVSGHGFIKRTLINKEVLDEHDRIIFGIDSIRNNDSDPYHRVLNAVDSELPFRNNNIEDHIASSIKRYYYINNSYDALSTKLQFSKYSRFLTDNIISKGKSNFYTQVYNPIIELIQNKIDFDGFNPVVIKIKSTTSKNKFIKYLSSYIFILTELDYYAKSLEQYKNSNYHHIPDSTAEMMIRSMASMRLLDSYEDESENTNLNLSQLKERFILLSNVFKNESYIESKSLIFTSVIDKVFNIEQAKE